MRIDVVIINLTKLMTCADTATVLRQEYYDLNKNLSQVVPITQDINNLENCAKLIVEECKSKQCKSVVIPSSSVANPNPGFNIDFIVGLINQEVFTEVLLKLNEYCLETILIQVPSDQIKESIEKKLAIKSDWSKARQLCFILDALKFKRSEVSESHYIHTKDYLKYLSKFYFNCKDDLLIIAKNIFIAKHGEKNENVFEIIKKFSEINELYLKLTDGNPSNSYKEFIKIMESEYVLMEWTTTKRAPNLMYKLQYINPLFVYIKHLIPDDSVLSEYRYYDSIKRTKNKKKSKKKSKKITIPNKLKPEVKNYYKTLLHIIDITRLLIQCFQLDKSEPMPFGINLLEEFWGKSVWERIKQPKIETDRELVIDLLAEHYCVVNSSITNIVYRKEC